MEVKGFKKFDVNAEKEKRYTSSPRAIQKAFEDGFIKITEIIDIEQIWIMSDKDYSGRIRKSAKLFPPIPLNESESYEHTIKHHISKNIDYEVTTDISKEDYMLLKNFYKKKGVQNKTRVYVSDVSKNYDDYIITIDYPNDKHDECWVEFELKDAKNKKEFVKPKWLVEKN